MSPGHGEELGRESAIRPRADAAGLDARRARLVTLFAAVVTHDRATLEAVRRAAPVGEPDAAWREVVLMAHLFCGFPRTLAAFEVLERVGGVGAPSEQELSAADSVVDAEGAALFDRIYGSSADTVRDALRGFHPDLARWIAEHAYARVLARPALEPATRELCAVAALAITGHDRQLASHARGAIRCGATAVDVQATLDLALPWIPEPLRARAREVAAQFAR
jgi:4-carboxymuconolactone decarboxylase